MDTLLYLDRLVTSFLSPLFVRSGIFEVVFRFLSLEGSWIYVWGLVLLGVATWEIFFRHDKHRFTQKLLKISAFATFSIVMVIVMIHFVFKPMFHRERPYVVAQVNTLNCPRDFSFPSGHAAAAFAGAVIFMYFDHNRRRDRLYLGVALLVSYSRIALQCHFVGDVVVGGLVGSGSSYGLLLLMQQIRSGDSSPLRRT